jgi:hypothetical protein
MGGANLSAAMHEPPTRRSAQPSGNRRLQSASVKAMAWQLSMLGRCGPEPPEIDCVRAYAIDSGTQDVVRGENRGRRLHHVAIAKELKQIGTVDDRTEFKTKLPLDSGACLIVFVQELGNGPVLAVAIRSAGR